MRTLFRGRRLLLAAALVLAAAPGCAGGGSGAHTQSRPTQTRPATTAVSPQGGSSAFLTPTTKAHLQAGSDPSVLPGPLLIADRSNNRLLVVNPSGQVTWEFPRPGDLGPGQTFQIPDDAFFSPDGKQIIATQEDDFVITVIDVATHRIVYRYGKPGVYGSGPNRLWNPDDAMILPGGRILTADIKNCRLLLIRLGAHRPSRIYGTTTQACYHQPPSRYGSPNGAFPMENGHFLVTEINGDWVDELTLGGRILGSWHPPGISYPSDSNEVRPGLYLTVDYNSPGAVETFDRAGHLHWRYRPRPGDPPLDHPSLALPLPNRDVLVTDDYHDRVIVIDPHTNRIVWQYGHTGVAGSRPGYLNRPDGVDLVPPYSLLVQHASAIAHASVPAG
jgi:hypothetical protein